MEPGDIENILTWVLIAEVVGIVTLRTIRRSRSRERDLYRWEGVLLFSTMAAAQAAPAYERPMLSTWAPVAVLFALAIYFALRRSPKEKSVNPPPRIQTPRLNETDPTPRVRVFGIHSDSGRR